MFLSRSKKPAGHDLYWFNMDLLLIDSKNLAELILCLFFRVFREIWILCIFSINLSSRMLLKKKILGVFNFAKSTKIRERKYTREN